MKVVLINEAYSTKALPQEPVLEPLAPSRILPIVLSPTHSQLSAASLPIPLDILHPALPQLSPLTWFCPRLGSRCSDFPTPHSLLTYISWYPANYVHLLNQAPRARKFEKLNNYLLVTNVPSHALGHRPRRNSWLIGEMRLTSPYHFGGPWHRVLMK